MPRGSTYITMTELGPPKPYTQDDLLGPNSIIVEYMGRSLN